jgi:acyl-CoA thioester hydrolase
MSEVFRHSHRVSYNECTVGNHIYHSRYLDLLEEARGEFMRHASISLAKLQEDDFVFPVIEASLRYKAPARYDDLLTIEVWLTELGRIRINFGHRVLNERGTVLVEAETKHVCATRHEKPRRAPEELLEKLRGYVGAPIAA